MKNHLDHYQINDRVKYQRQFWERVDHSYRHWRGTVLSVQPLPAYHGEVNPVKEHLKIQWDQDQDNDPKGAISSNIAKVKN